LAPKFSTPVILHTYPPMKMEQTECSETSAYKIQTPGNYPKESIQRLCYSTICHLASERKLIRSFFDFWYWVSTISFRKTGTDECMVCVYICVNQNIVGFTLVCLMLQLALHVAVLSFCVSLMHTSKTPLPFQLT